jgi:hypothetical protein
MSAALQRALDGYRAGLDRQVASLEALARVSASQHEACLQRDADALWTMAAEREAVMAALSALESEQRPLRDQLADALPLAERLAGFEDVHRLHRVACRLLDEVEASDLAILTCLEQNELARRAAAHVLDAGGATLAAYRKTTSLASPRSSIVDSRF